jgi:stage V sporulation protein B
MSTPKRRLEKGSNTSSSSKLLKGSFMIMISYFIFRFGGYVYRLLMARLLGPEGYGLWGLTLPFQGVLMILSAAGFTTAIARYVSHYKALGDDQMARQVVFTSLKFMMFMGIFFALVMFFSAPYIANNYFHKPEVMYPLQAVALITPFSVIVGAFRGSFQGLYKMEYIVATRAVEQVFTIVLGVVLVSIGFYAAGAVLGTAFGFMASAISAVIIFRKYLWKYLPAPDPEFKFTVMQELGLIKSFLGYSIPVAITALSEMGIYDISTLVMGYFLAANFIGYYTAADPIARFPLVISLAVATVMLPAASEASALKDKKLLTTYVVQSYRYVTLIVLPMCIGISLFAQPIMELLFGGVYVNGAGALSILVIGMAFYTLFMVSSSISQGIGHSRIPMYILLAGVGINLALNWAFVSIYGTIESSAVATTIAAFLIMVAILWKVFKITQIRLPYGAFGKIIIASFIMSITIIFLPQNLYGLIAAFIIAPVVYTGALILFKGFEKRDVRMMRRIGGKLGPLSGIFEKVVKFIEKYAQ